MATATAVLARSSRLLSARNITTARPLGLGLLQWPRDDRDAASARRQHQSPLLDVPRWPSPACRGFHSSAPRENAIIIAGLGVASAAIGAKYVLQLWQSYQARPKAEKVAAKWTYRNFYDGPFEERMTRREAALILGVRESASPERIRNAHRKLLILNHPDTGGSTFLATKINQAKEMLLSGQK